MHKKTVIDFKEIGHRLVFTQAIKELKTKNLEEVTQLLAQAESYQKEGYYVVGYVSYEAAPAFETHLHVHDQALMGEYLLYFTVHDTVQRQALPLSYEDVAMETNWQELTSEEDYQKAIERIHHHIRQGDTYQVNYTVQLQQEMRSDPFAIYNRLMVEQKAHYNAFIQHDDVSIISISPELFFKKEGSSLLTRPMKGTTARGLTSESDLKQAAWLAQDPKNRAENMMIVDLLRNDMNRISKIGSEKIVKLCDVEQYSTVWQMTSTIETQLHDYVDLVQIFQALFPCGSITGAPKIATMTIIKAIEKQARGVYCGTIGLLLPQGPSIFNVAIRTIQMTGQKAIYGVGGGITWDSSWQAEYQETKQKAAVLYRQQPSFDLISTALIEHGQVTFLNQHLKRLQDAARYFAYPFNLEEARQLINHYCQRCESKQAQRLRLSLTRTGEFKLEAHDLEDLTEDFLQATLVQQKQDLKTPFVYFKTTYRPHLSLDKHEHIYYNEQGQLLETSIGNIILKIDNQLYTPPVDLGILDGIYRQHLLASGKVREKVLSLEDLQKAEAIYGCNAVRGLYQLTVNEKSNKPHERP